MNLYESFLEEMKLKDAPVLEKAIACELLELVIKEPSNSNYSCIIDAVKNSDYILNLVQDKTLTQVLSLSGYWSNDLMAILINSLKEKNIDSLLVNNGFKAIFYFLNTKILGGSYDTELC